MSLDWEATRIALPPLEWVVMTRNKFLVCVVADQFDESFISRIIPLFCRRNNQPVSMLIEKEIIPFLSNLLLEEEFPLQLMHPVKYDSGITDFMTDGSVL